MNRRDIFKGLLGLSILPLIKIIPDNRGPRNTDDPIYDKMLDDWSVKHLSNGDFEVVYDST